MKYYQETTEWQYPNHIYLLNDSKTKMHGYIKKGTDEVQMFTKPMSFSTKLRTFVVVDIEVKKKQDNKVYEVQGSKGNTYIIEDKNGHLECSCPGFTYRGSCKHLKQVK